MPVRVLLVDDDAAIRETLTAILRMEHAEVTAATCARDAVQQLAAGAFDLVITDMRMETPNAGVDVVRAAADLDPRPLVVILSAFPIAEQARGAGASVLLKGTDPFGLVEKLRGVIAAAGARKPSGSAGGGPSTGRQSRR
jgi:CheY-like chemotaxis protein